jgi:hypothetical protein
MAEFKPEEVQALDAAGNEVRTAWMPLRRVLWSASSLQCLVLTQACGVLVCVQVVAAKYLAKSGVNYPQLSRPYSKWVSAMLLMRRRGALLGFPVCLTC